MHRLYDGQESRRQSLRPASIAARVGLFHGLAENLYLQQYTTHMRAELVPKGSDGALTGEFWQNKAWR